MSRWYQSGMVRRVSQAVLLVAVGVGGLLVGVAPVSAGPNCAPVVGWCSTTVNDSSFSAVALFNWCRANDGTSAWTAIRPTCSDEGAAQKSLFLTSGGGHTPFNQDWDSFQVDAGWCYKVKFVVTAGNDFTRIYDRRGASAIWVKVGDDADAHIQGQGSATCP